MMLHNTKQIFLRLSQAMHQGVPRTQSVHKPPASCHKCAHSTSPLQRKLRTRAACQNMESRRSLAIRCQTSRREALLRSRWPWYDKYFAYSMAYGMQDYEKQIAAHKAALFDELFTVPVASLLEVGIGTGANNRFYASQQGMQITGVDPNPEMAPYAVDAAQAAQLDIQNLSLLQGTAEQLPVEGQSQDAVVSTLVLCSVPNVDRALAEIQRVLKPGGKFLFIEHVLAPDVPLRIMQRLLDPLQQAVANGCHLSRNTHVSIQSSGFASAHSVSFTVPGLGLIAPHIAGIATMKA